MKKTIWGFQRISVYQFLPQIISGALIGLGTAVLLLFNGQITGISGIYGQLIRLEFGAKHGRIAFLIDLLPRSIY